MGSEANAPTANLPNLPADALYLRGEMPTPQPGSMTNCASVKDYAHANWKPAAYRRSRNFTGRSSFLEISQATGNATIAPTTAATEISAPLSRPIVNAAITAEPAKTVPTKMKMKPKSLPMMIPRIGQLRPILGR